MSCRPRCWPASCTGDRLLPASLTADCVCRSPDRTQVLACLEVTQAEEDMQFGTVTDVLEGVLAQCGLFTTPKSQGIKPMKVTDELSGDPVAQNSEQTSNSREMGSSQSQVRVQSAVHMHA